MGQALLAAWQQWSRRQRVPVQGSLLVEVVRHVSFPPRGSSIIARPSPDSGAVPTTQLVLTMCP
jgi:hypothetical protein